MKTMIYFLSLVLLASCTGPIEPIEPPKDKGELILGKWHVAYYESWKDQELIHTRHFDRGQDVREFDDEGNYTLSGSGIPTQPGHYRISNDTIFWALGENPTLLSHELLIYEISETKARILDYSSPFGHILIHTFVR